MKKLEKADAKRKQKSEKRDKVVDDENDGPTGPTTNQVIQKKDLKNDQSGKVIDIRIENFDLAYGSK